MSLTASAGTARVTLVVTQRERMAHTERSLEQILANTSEPFRLIYVDGGSPPDVRAYLERRAAETGFTLVRCETTLWPNVARNLAMPLVETEYTCFIDNEVIVEEGWLGKLIACADETGAAIVGPLYLIGGGNEPTMIHMAGGDVTLVDTEQGVLLHEQHRLINAPLSKRAECARGPCDYAEYHCKLTRTDFVRTRLSEEIVCVHEHVDLGLEAKRAGLPVIVEPAAAVTHLAFEPWRLSDLALFRRRWTPQAASQSLAGLVKKWGFIDDGKVFKGVFQFLQNQHEAVDPIWYPVPTGERQSPAVAADIRQSLYGLLGQASARGYQRADLAKFSHSYYAAMTLFDGGYRPCGRPFLAHCVGTASALVHFGFAPRLVVAGMLHAAYSHAAVGKTQQAALSFLEQQLRTTFGEDVESIVRNYARVQLGREAWRHAHPAAEMMMSDAEIVALIIANEIDEWASGEALVAPGRKTLAHAWHGYFREVAAGLELPALAETLANLSQTPAPQFETRAQKESYRLHQGGLVKMAHGTFQMWDQAPIAAE